MYVSKTICRAKNPETCRYHGTRPQISHKTRVPKAATPTYLLSERKLLNVFTPHEHIVLNGEEYEILFAAKPLAQRSGGEPKTDAFVQMRSITTDETRALKITYKQENADFIENKLSADRAEIFFGPEKNNILLSYFKKTEIPQRTLHDLTGMNYTIGFRLDLMNKDGKNYVPHQLSPKLAAEIYSGALLPSEKKNALVNGVIVPDSGVASHVFTGEVTSAQNVADNLVTIEEYVKDKTTIYVAFKAVNLRLVENTDGELLGKWDGNRPIFMPVEWVKNADGSFSREFKEEEVFTHHANILAQKFLRNL